MAEDGSIFPRTLIVISERVRRVGEGGDGGVQLLDAQLRIQHFPHAVHGLDALGLLRHTRQGGPGLGVEPDFRFIVNITAQETPVVHNGAPEPFAVPAQGIHQLLLLRIHLPVAVHILGMPGQHGQVLHLQ
ncbi:hypothetical protein D3C75_869520 [compost metagenome]